MRKVLALLLLAGVSAPALAAADPGDNNRFHANREARQEARSEARAARSDDSDRQHSNTGSGGDHKNKSNESGGPPPQPVVQVESSAGHQAGAAHIRSGGGFRQVRQDEQPVIQAAAQDHGDAPDGVRNWRADERRSGGPRIVEPRQVPDGDRAFRRQDRPVANAFRNRVPVVSNVPHQGTQPPLRVDSRSRDRDHHWDTSWRNDQRYNWSDWRRHHRSTFHLGFYYDPFGWGYNPFQIGWRMWPNYYSSNYWINDPWEYRLPYAPPGYRWVRYWDDAVLVDTFTGEVRDVIHNFFW
jgi:hypothetical protein